MHGDLGACFARTVRNWEPGEYGQSQGEDSAKVQEMAANKRSRYTCTGCVQGIIFWTSVLHGPQPTINYWCNPITSPYPLHTHTHTPEKMLYGGPCNLRPLHLMILSILGPAISDTTLIFSIYMSLPF